MKHSTLLIIWNFSSTFLQLSLHICGNFNKSFHNLPNYFRKHTRGACSIFHLCVILIFKVVFNLLVILFFVIVLILDVIFQIILIISSIPSDPVLTQCVQTEPHYLSITTNIISRQGQSVTILSRYSQAVVVTVTEVYQVIKWTLLWNIVNLLALIIRKRFTFS